MFHPNRVFSTLSHAFLSLVKKAEIAATAIAPDSVVIAFLIFLSNSFLSVTD